MRWGQAAKARAAQRGVGAAHIVVVAAAAQPQHQVERGLLLDVVVRQRAAILELLARKDQALLVRRNSLLVLRTRALIVSAAPTKCGGENGVLSRGRGMEDRGGEREREAPGSSP